MRPTAILARPPADVKIRTGGRDRGWIQYSHEDTKARRTWRNVLRAAQHGTALNAPRSTALRDWITACSCHATALKGRPNTAPGNARVLGMTKAEALKGRTNALAFTVSRGSPERAYECPRFHGLPRTRVGPPSAAPWDNPESATEYNWITACSCHKTALKGRPNTAPGNARVLGMTKAEALKGRTNALAFTVSRRMPSLSRSPASSPDACAGSPLPQSPSRRRGRRGHECAATRRRRSRHGHQSHIAIDSRGRSRIS